jgi:hypothetical protein
MSQTRDNLDTLHPHFVLILFLLVLLDPVPTASPLTHAPHVPHQLSDEAMANDKLFPLIVPNDVMF